MEKTIEIPEGYEARIEGNKVILERKESEDNRIRREIIDYFYGCIHRNKKTGFRVEQIKGWIAYLERQKEGNLVDKKYVQEAFNKGMQAGMMQKPAKWSEEEEKDIQEASDYLRDYANNCVQGGNSKLYIQSLADRIESIRSKPHWKPSEEQMNELLAAIECLETQNEDVSILNSLYEDLKKL